jgi:hypothetical protein
VTTGCRTNARIAVSLSEPLMIVLGSSQSSVVVAYCAAQRAVQTDYHPRGCSDGWYIE